MQLKRFIQFSVFFLILVGALSSSAGPQSINESANDLEMYNPNVPKAKPVDSPPSLAEQDLEINQLVWSRSYASPGADVVQGLVECKDGNSCILVTLDISSNWRPMLIKIDPSGNQIWNKTYLYADMNSGNSLICCSDGGFVFTGEFENLTMGGLDGSILMKTNSTGHLQWNVLFYDIIILRDVIQIEDDGFVMVGLAQQSHETAEDIVVIRTDENGTRLWTKYYGSYEAEEGIQIIKCRSGGYTISGLVYLNSYTIYESILMRIDEIGNLLWYRTYGDDVYFGAGSIIECKNGDFLVGGDPGMLRTDSNGNPLFALNFYGGFLVAFLFDDNRIAGTSSTHIGITDENQTLIQRYYVDSISLRGLVRCTNGEFIAAGSAFNDVNVARVPWLDWNETMTEVECEYAESFLLKLNATCSQGIESWSVDDDLHFQIDSQGLLSNTSFLDVGEYPVEIIVNDTLGNQLIQRFTVIVEDILAPIWLETPGTVILEVGNNFIYDLNATDASGTLLWSLGATYTFTITQTGVITNTMQLAVGTYHINVHVQDASGNILMGTVTLQVEDTQYPVYLVPPSNQVFSYGELIEFDIIAYDISGIATWSQNCTDFTMLLDTDGPITTAHFTSNGILSLGVYLIEITIGDTYDNNVTTSMSITVTEETSTTTETTTTSTTTTTTTSTSTSSTTTEGIFDDTQILMLGLGSGIGGAVLVLVVFQLIKRRSP